ncbi:hypothetical protein CPB84DRAFT_1783005 [Gymnopilus junonius]|uniref:F-box domain-containing protein n=1 Tax=Gymnopilus junonius TaxID=109634 RepID=A0A9P5NI29_GYMJU|nr:hypothetical protein CPB84DRAFT_1783005 [Gymnopilus junonius]
MSLTLHPDLLWQIFLMAADMEEDDDSNSAFYNVFQASHVCQSWRDLIVGSSSLWARIIDLTVLSKAHDDLRKEILRRTGNTLLSIKGRINDSWVESDVNSPIQFLLSLLRDEWARTRDLDVIIHGTALNILTGQFSRLLCRPAPALRTFRFQPPYNGRYHIQNASLHDLFLNHAPLLVDFKFPSLPYPLRATWLCHLLSLDLIASPGVLDILEVTPFLETLCLDERRQLVFSANDTSQFGPLEKRIPLDRLRRIHLEEVSESSLRILDQITPAPDCVLVLSSVNFEFLPPPNPRGMIIKSIITRFSGGPQTHISFLSFDYGQSSFSLSTRSEGANHPFTVLGRSTKNVLSENTFTFLLNTISLFQLNKVTKLHISVNSVTLYMLKLSLINPIYRTFFSSFRSVGTLRANPDLLKFLLLLFRPDQPVFPSLRTIEVVDSNEWQDKDVILNFLKRRKEFDSQIHTLDLTQCTNPMFAEEDFLERAKQLDVEVCKPLQVVQFTKNIRRGQLLHKDQ